LVTLTQFRWAEGELQLLLRMEQIRFLVRLQLRKAVEAAIKIALFQLPLAAQAAVMGKGLQVGLRLKVTRHTGQDLETMAAQVLLQAIQAAVVVVQAEQGQTVQCQGQVVLEAMAAVHAQVVLTEHNIAAVEVAVKMALFQQGQVEAVALAAVADI